MSVPHEACFPITVNSSVPFPPRPSAFVTAMSKLAIAAVSATVIFAVNSVLLTKVVELTVTPPGSVVPVTNHFALAPFLL